MEHKVVFQKVPFGMLKKILFQKLHSRMIYINVMGIKGVFDNEKQKKNYMGVYLAIRGVDIAKAFSNS